MKRVNSAEHEIRCIQISYISVIGFIFQYFICIAEATRYLDLALYFDLPFQFVGHPNKPLEIIALTLVWRSHCPLKIHQSSNLTCL